MEAVHRCTPEEQSVRLHRDLKARIPSACLGPAICKWFLLQEAQKVHRDARRGVCVETRGDLPAGWNGRSLHQRRQHPDS